MSRQRSVSQIRAYPESYPILLGGRAKSALSESHSLFFTSLLFAFPLLCFWLSLFLARQPLLALALARLQFRKSQEDINFNNHSLTDDSLTTHTPNTAEPGSSSLPSFSYYARFA